MFQKINISNFKSFGGNSIFDLEQYQKGLVFVEGVNKQNAKLGSNGSGKSTLFDAIIWGFFGRTSRGLKALKDIKSYNSSGETFVELFINKDNKHYKIKRKASPSAVLVDGENNEELSIKLIGVSQEVFNQGVLFGQFNPSLFDLSPTDRKVLFDNVLDLSIWVELGSLCRRQATELYNSVTNKQHELNGLETGLGGLELSIKERKVSLEIIQAKKPPAIYDISIFQKEETGLEAVIAKLREEIKNRLDERSQVQDEINTYERQITFLKQERLSISNRKTELDNQINAHNVSINEKKQCPLCLTSIDTITDFGKVALSNKLHVLYEERKGQEERLIEIETKLKTLTSFLSKRYAVLEVIPVPNERDCLDREKELLDLRVMHAEINTAHQEKIKQVEQITLSINNDLERLSKFKETINNLSRQIAEISKNMELYKYWQEAFPRIAQEQRSLFFDTFKSLVSHNLSELGLLNSHIEIGASTEGSIKRLELHPIINNELLSSGNLSGGELQRFKIATSAAFGEMVRMSAGVDFGFEVWDEPTAHLGEDGVESVVNFLRARAERLDIRIFFIDHRTLDHAFSDTVTIIKNDLGVSEIGDNTTR